MTTIEDFVTLVRDEVGLPVTPGDLEADLDSVPGWDSMHLLTLMMALERSTGRSISLPELLEAPSLGQVYRLATSS